MQQEKALAILKSGKNVFLTGSAGTGKTYVLNQYIEYLKERKVAVAITASTGIAATHMNGMTIHSWAGIGVKEHLTQANLASMKSKKYLKDHLEKVKVLVIDEISMLHKNQLNLVDKVLQYFKGTMDPFGGVQVVLCGDFFQLPPIGNRGELSRDKFAFMSEAWAKSGLAVCNLTEQYRQNDNDLNEILNQIRARNVTDSSFKKLQAAANNTIKKEQEPTKLYTHNYDVDNVNYEQLSKLSGQTKTFKAKTKGNAKLIETLKKSVLAREHLQFKIGAKVMFVKNDSEKNRYVNGSLGTILGFNDKGLPSVKLLNGKTIYAAAESWTIQDDGGKILASYNQIPLRLAWAITVHKCQGMTLDAAEIDLSKTFEKGQGYVALSRLKKLENLHLIGLNKTALEVDGLAYKADQRFQELSTEVDNNFSFEELDIMAEVFMKNIGGLTDTSEIEKNKKKIIEKKLPKQSTYDRTFAFLKEKKTIEEIAKERGMTPGTIAGHLIKIRKDNPKADLSFYQPKKAMMNKVKKVHDTLTPGENGVSLTAIFKALDGKVSYDDIKMVIAFL